MTLFWFDSWIWKDLLVTGIQKTPSRFIVISIKLGLSSEVGWRLDRGELDSLVRRHVFLTSCFRWFLKQRFRTLAYKIIHNGLSGVQTIFMRSQEFSAFNLRIPIERALSCSDNASLSEITDSHVILRTRLIHFRNPTLLDSWGTIRKNIGKSGVVILRGVWGSGGVTSFDWRYLVRRVHFQNMNTRSVSVIWELSVVDLNEWAIKRSSHFLPIAWRYFKTIAHSSLHHT